MAARRHVAHEPLFVVQGDEPLIAIPGTEDGEDAVTYFTSEEAADAATTDDIVRTALALAGAWSDLSWEDVEAALYRIRHESEPTPPLDP